MRDELFFQHCSEFVREFYNNDAFSEMYIIGGTDFDFTIFEFEKEVEKLDSYNKLKKYMNDNDIISKHIVNMIGLWSYRINLKEWGYIKYFIEKQKIYSSGKFVLDYDKFLVDYKKLEDFFYNDNFLMRQVIRLINFTSDVDEIILKDNLRIKKLKDDDYRKMLYGNISQSDRSEYVVEMIFEENKRLGEDLDQKTAQEGFKRRQERSLVLNRVINILRLYKSGNIKTGETFIRLVEPVIVLGVGMGFMPTMEFYLNTYHMKNDEVPDFLEFWEKIESIDISEFKEYSLALRRLGFAMDRTRYDDKLVDLVISYESLLFKQGESGELQYRISLRLSKLLEEDYGKRVDVRKAFKEIYKIRSRIVHGSEYIITVEIINSCEDLLRKALRKYLVYREKMSHNRIIDSLDLSEL